VIAGASTPAASNQAAQNSGAPMRGARSRSAGVARPPSRASRSGVHRTVWAEGIRKCASRPGQSPAGAQGQVERLAGQVDDPAGGVQPHGDARMGDLEAAQARRQPVAAHALYRGDRQHAFLGVDQVGHRRAQDAHRLAGRSRQALARRGQGDLAGQAGEQRLVQALLQGLHLPADGGLADAQLVGGAGEALQARGGFEDPDGAERQAGEDVWHK
jgi:hypothetical protein